MRIEREMGMEGTGNTLLAPEQNNDLKDKVNCEIMTFHSLSYTLGFPDMIFRKQSL